MIIVNVHIPALEKIYDFSVEEKARISDLIEELVELVAQKESISFSGSLDAMALCIIEKGEQCAGDKCLNDYGVCGGAELILV